MKKILIVISLGICAATSCFANTSAENDIIALLRAILANGGTGGGGGAVTQSGIWTVQSSQKQYTGTPSTFTVGTANATVFTLAAGEMGFIQNLDDAALAVKKGASASSSSFSLILAAGTLADDGKGGYIRIADYVGEVSVAAMTGSPRFIAWKQAP